MTTPSSEPAKSERASSILSCLAQSLDCSVESFSDPQSHELSETLELLSLWLTIDDRQGRMKALTLLRNVKTRGQVMDKLTVPAPGEPVALAYTRQKPDSAL